MSTKKKKRKAEDRKKEEKWREFEVLLTRIHQSLAPGADVKHNQLLMGRAGRRRQIDILITQSVPPYVAKIAVECRQYKRRVTMEKFEAFHGKLGDVGIGQGVMVTSVGFDAGAQAAANQCNIKLLTYRAATDLDWQSVTSDKAWIRLLSHRLELISARALVPNEQHRVVGNADNIQLRDRLTSEKISIKTFVEQALIDTIATRRPGQYQCFARFASDTVVDYENREVLVTGMEIIGRVRAFEHIVNISLASGHILTDVPSGERSAGQFVTESWDMHALLDSAPDRELTADEWQTITTGATNPPFVIDPRNTKRFMRMVVEHKRIE